MHGGWTTMAVGAMMLVHHGAAAEGIDQFVSERNRSGYPCILDITAQSGTSAALQLADEKGMWVLRIFVSGAAPQYLAFFGQNDLRDERDFADAFGVVTIGSREFRLRNAVLFAVTRSEIDERTTASFEIVERHNVSAALNAMAGDGLAIPDLIDLDGTEEATTEFRECAYQALGLQEGETVATDHRAELRLIFEESFEGWVRLAATASACGVAKFDADTVDDVISSASSAFYPGVMNLMVRRAYREQLLERLPLLKLAGSTDALTGSCPMAGYLAELSRIPVDKAIDAAAAMD